MLHSTIHNKANKQTARLRWEKERMGVGWRVGRGERERGREMEERVIHNKNGKLEKL